MKRYNVSLRGRSLATGIEMVSTPNLHMPGKLRVLRTAALIAIAVGAAGSLSFMLRAGQRSPRVLLVLFFFWVLAPFVALLAAHVFSKRWSAPVQTTLYWVMLAVTLGSLAAYANDAVNPRKAQAAFVYVMVPPASCVFAAIVVLTAALISRRRPGSEVS